MSRWATFWIGIIAGGLLLISGLLVPAHLRAVDPQVLKIAGRGSPSVRELALAFIKERNPGAARLLRKASEREQIPWGQDVDDALTAAEQADPMLARSGAPPPLLHLSRPPATGAAPAILPVTDLFIPEENRTRALESFTVSRDVDLARLLRTRELTNTVLFAPSQSGAGQAFDAALCVAGLLLQERQLGPGLANDLAGLARSALGSRTNTQRFEQALLDLMSLGQRLNWGQLTAVASRLEDVETLRLLAGYARKSERDQPILFSAALLSGQPAAVVGYLTEYSVSGMRNLGAGLRYGAGGLRELLQRKQQLAAAHLRSSPLSARIAWQYPLLMLIFKWLLYGLAGFSLAAAARALLSRPASARPRADLVYRAGHEPRGRDVPPSEFRPGFPVARQILFALGFLLAMLLVTEPYLSHESQRMEMPFRLRVPMTASAAQFATTHATSSLMNQLSLLTLLLFFVLQSLLYTASLVKLAEIRRQRLPARIKVRLLENEDHLFDAGLYLGFVGTIISLIMVSLGVIKPSLMAAYSSTSFGIIFVSIFKIFHLRPLRRELVLEAERAAEPATASPTPILS